MAIEFLPNVTAPTPNVPLTAMIGGTLANPVAPAVTVLATGIGRSFVADRQARFFYYIDGSGNLQRWDAANPGTAAVEIAAAGAIGAVNFMTIAPDNSAIYATVGNTVIKILTASPYTVTTLATGFGGASGIDYDVINGVLRVWDATAGGPSTVTLSGGVTSLGGIVGSNPTPLAVGKSGNFYFVRGGTSLYQGGTSLFSEGGNYHGGICVDDDEPTEACLYFFRVAVSGGGGTELNRCVIANSTITSSIAATPAEVVTGGEITPCMYFRNDSFDPTVNPALYVVDSAGNLCRIEA